MEQKYKFPFFFKTIDAPPYTHKHTRSHTHCSRSVFGKYLACFFLTSCWMGGVCHREKYTECHSSDNHRKAKESQLGIVFGVLRLTWRCMKCPDVKTTPFSLWMCAIKTHFCLHVLGELSCDARPLWLRVRASSRQARPTTTAWLHSEHQIPSSLQSCTSWRMLTKNSSQPHKSTRVLLSFKLT